MLAPTTAPEAPMDDSRAHAPRPAEDDTGVDDDPGRGVRVWDLPLRLWHWALAAAVGTSLYTGLTGGFEEMDWHQTSGFIVLGLLLFRLAWGFVGPRHARFGDFLAGPRRLVDWTRGALRGAPPAVAGHNPVAGWTIVALLLALAVQAGTGLFASDDLFVEGPLVHLVEDDAVSLATSVHAWGQWTVGGLVALHLVALVVHRLAFGERLVGAMITGRRRGIARADGIDGQRVPLAVVLGGLAAGIVWWVVTRL
jgi:cytochrome b